MFELVSLFLFAFMAATVLPGASEAYLVSLYFEHQHEILVLFLVATAGNVAGSTLNWVMGKYLLHFKDRKWFPVKDKELNKATKLYNKWGVWSLLLAWMPIVGDGLTLLAGVFKTNIWLFLILVTIGKSARYLAVLYIAMKF